MNSTEQSEAGTFCSLGLLLHLITSETAAVNAGQKTRKSRQGPFKRSPPATGIAGFIASAYFGPLWLK